MNQVHLNVITHLHTYASNGPASSLDHLAKSILSDVFGTIPEGLVWRECFTSVDDIRHILAGKKTKKRIDIVFLTDHMSSRYHRLDEDLMLLATEDRRIGLGCEIQTVSFSAKQGRFVTAPEVLLYGGETEPEFAGQRYSGVDDATIAKLYSECTVAGATEPEISRVNSFCRENNIAFVLAHPFDCQQLDLEETLDVIAAFPFVEAVNGGFPHRSARALREYVDFHNQMLGHGLLTTHVIDELTAVQKKRIEKISASQILVPLGGSDAHLNHFDRVVTRFNTVSGKTMAADFIKVMLNCTGAEIVQQKRMEPVGCGCSMVGLYKDVLGIIYKNIRVYWLHFSKPQIWPGLMRTLMTTGLGEFRLRINRNRSIAVDYRQQLDVAGIKKIIAGHENKKSQAQSYECLQ